MTPRPPKSTLFPYNDALPICKTIYHFYLAYFKPLWTDCQTEGYSTDNFCMVLWKRPTNSLSDNERDRFLDRKSTRLNSSHGYISYAVFCLKKKNYTSNCCTQS